MEPATKALPGSVIVPSSHSVERASWKHSVTVMRDWFARGNGSLSRIEDRVMSFA